MPLYKYLCKAGHEFEDFSSVASRHNKQCPECGGKARMQVCPVRLDYYNMGTSPSMPTAWDKWARMHEKEARRESD